MSFTYKKNIGLWRAATLFIVLMVYNLGLVSTSRTGAVAMTRGSEIFK